MKTKLITAAVASLVVGGFAVSTPVFANEHETTAGQKVDDATLLAKIKTNLLRSPEVEGLDVNVDVRGGVVTLSGAADTQMERSNAEKIAMTSDGVKRVDNRIVIKADNKADLQPALPPTAAPGTVPPPPAN